MGLGAGKAADMNQLLISGALAVPAADRGDMPKDSDWYRRRKAACHRDYTVHATPSSIASSSSSTRSNCNSRRSKPVEHHLAALQHLSIDGLPNLVSFPDGGLPTPNLTGFSVERCVSLKLLPDRMHTLTALQHLSISNLPNVVSFAQGGCPPNLQRLSIRDGDLLQTLLNEQLLPATLHTLRISYVWNLKSLDGKGFEHLTSLQHLRIERCESLEFLPKEGLPASLSHLSIWGCPCLKKGKDWRNIARIPCIKIDDEITI